MRYSIRLFACISGMIVLWMNHRVDVSTHRVVPTLRTVANVSTSYVANVSTSYVANVSTHRVVPILRTYVANVSTYRVVPTLRTYVANEVFLSHGYRGNGGRRRLSSINVVPWALPSISCIE